MVRTLDKDEDIFKSPAQVYVNPVNCVGVAGAGLAKEFRRRYPAQYDSYNYRCSRGLETPGNVHLHRTMVEFPLYIATMATKNHWTDNSKIEDIELGLRNLHREMKAERLTSVALPAVGCGLGGLKFDDVKKLVEAEFGSDGKITVYLYPPK